jgi:hypothetical protein
MAHLLSGVDSHLSYGYFEWNIAVDRRNGAKMCFLLGSIVQREASMLQ